MSEHSAHTPAPWGVSEARGPDNELCFYYIDGPDGAVASTWACAHEANARLIAASPDLLAACVQFIETFDRCGGSESVSPEEFADRRMAIRAAIAKATGKETP